MSTHETRLGRLGVLPLWRVCLLSLALEAPFVPLCADTVVLKNGNVLEGEILGDASQVVFLKLPSGTVRIPKRRVRSIERSRQSLDTTAPGPSDELLGARQRQAEAQRQMAIFLKDRRRVDGTWKSRAGGRAVVESMYGVLAFPEWLVEAADDGAVAEKWRFVRPLRHAQSFDLLEELRRRHERAQEDQRRRALRNQADWELVEGKAEDLKRYVADADRAALVRLARELGPLRSELSGRERERCLNLAVNAYGEASRLAAEGSTCQTSFAAARLRAERAQLLLLSGTFPGVEALEESLRLALQCDAALWAPALRVMETMETYAAAALLDPAEAPWRIDETPVELGGLESSGLPMFLVRKGAQRLVLPQPPRSADGVDSVWVPRAGGGGWQRISWCPVDRDWVETTVPERILLRSRGLIAFVQRQLEEERKETKRLFQSLGRYDLALENLAASYYVARSQSLRDGWQAEFRRANEALRDLREANELSLRRRAHSTPALLRVWELHGALEQAAAGNPVDVEALGFSRRAHHLPGSAAEAQSIVAALESYELDLRLETLRGEAIRQRGDAEGVRKALEALLAGPFTLPEVRELAETVKRTWAASPSGGIKPPRRRT